MSSWFNPLNYFLPLSSPSQKFVKKEKLLSVFTLAQLVIVNKIKAVANVTIQIVDTASKGFKNRFITAANHDENHEDSVTILRASHAKNLVQKIAKTNEWTISQAREDFLIPPSPNHPKYSEPPVPPSDPTQPPPEYLLANANPFTVYSTLPKNPLLLLPAFLLALYKSEEKIIQNINVHLSASPWSKVYQIGFGNKNENELSIAFEVRAGAPIRLLHEDTTLRSTNDQLPVIFKPENLFNYLPIPHCFIWKREKRETDCNIFIDDPGNPFLQEGPIKTYIPISPEEGFHLIHRDPKKSDHETSDGGEGVSPRDIFRHGSTRLEKIKQVGKTTLATAVPPPLKEIVRVADIFSCAGTNTATMKIKHMDSSLKSRTEFFPLPFYDDPKKAQEYYLKVTQIQ